MVAEKGVIIQNSSVYLGIYSLVHQLNDCECNLLEMYILF